MKQYQLSLDSHTISLLDTLEKKAHIPVSKLLQSRIKQFAIELTRTFSTEKESETPTLDNLIGIIKTKGNKTTNYATKSDRLYLDD